MSLIIPTDNQCNPKIIDGQRAEWKKAQKKPKNNIISDIINKINPNLNIFEQLKYDIH